MTYSNIHLEAYGPHLTPPRGDHLTKKGLSSSATLHSAPLKQVHPNKVSDGSSKVRRLQLTLDVQLVTDPFGIYKAPNRDNEYEDAKKMMASMKVRDDDLETDYTDGDSAFEDYQDYQDEGYGSDAESDYDLYDPWIGIPCGIKTTSGALIGGFTYRVIYASARVVGEDDDLNLVWKLYDSSRSGKSLKNFILTLYDNDTGLLCSEYLPGGSRSGTATFKDELNNGTFAYLSDDTGDELFVDQEYRGRGVGSWVLDAVKKHSSLEEVQFIFSHPRAAGMSKVGEKNDREGNNHTKVQKFFRKNGFRRVGQSPYFAYALRDTKHPSRVLDATKDAEYKPQSCTHHLAFKPLTATGSDKI
ncbi:hypothetical protein BDQ17DRAFT_1423206 [Cyathus striatus]|nr:hypothetical protein BDQ17DRAFT_1423206 [Cyathus striatus]